jgi:hypothetical protein
VIHRYVTEEWQSMLPAKITTYLPIFATRQARQRLQAGR